MIETQFCNFQLYFKHIFFDEVRSQISDALLAIREGYTRCPAHQWMRVEKLVSMLLVSARDLNPQIKIFKKHSGPRSEGQRVDGGKSSSSPLGLKSVLATLDIASGGNKISDFLTLGLTTHDFDLGHCLRRQKNSDLCDLGSGKPKTDHQTCFKCTLNLGPGTLKVR